jgi:hypothetical protein
MVERQLPKLDVAGSIPVARSTLEQPLDVAVEQPIQFVDSGD